MMNAKKRSVISVLFMCGFHSNGQISEITLSSAGNNTSISDINFREKSLHEILSHILISIIKISLQKKAGVIDR